MADESEIVIAERIARAAHAGQTEQSTGDDYIHHIERVVAMVDGDPAQAVAWLHDVLEDTAMTAADLRRAGISSRVVAAVWWLTRRECDSYPAYIERLKASGDPLALVVKIADLRDHLRPNCPPSLRPRYEAAWEALGCARLRTAANI